MQVRANPEMELELHKTGKIPLREAFPESFSAWRRKDPIEIGSGSTELSRPTFWTDLISTEELEGEKKRILEQESVTIRDSEHLWYYREFLRQFPGVWTPISAAELALFTYYTALKTFRMHMKMHKPSLETQGQQTQCVSSSDSEAFTQTVV